MSKIDKSALKFNQFCIVFFVAAAFILNLKWLTAAVALVLITGTIFPGAGLFKLFYKNILRKTGLIKPELSQGDNSPHLFAQGLGGIFLTLSFILLTFLNTPVLGWILALAVLFLALVNLTFNFCLGCFLYYQLNKKGLFRLTPEAKN